MSATMQQLTDLLRDVEAGIADAQRLLPGDPTLDAWRGVDHLFALCAPAARGGGA